jgi:glutamate---cysteine ligase / carboxylate-amine ligase
MSPRSELYTIGVEEEYQIINPVTRELSPDSETILPDAQKTLGDEVQLEIQLAQIEIATSICRTLADVRTQLARKRHEVIAAAAKHNLQIAAAASHPFSYWSDQKITPHERYLSLEDDYMQLSREQSIFGCHVHVGINDRELAVQAMNHMRPWLASLLALSSNSPFWWGTDTGYYSYRTEVWSRWPFSGPPPIFSSLADRQALITTLIDIESVSEPTKIYWDMRLSERFDTIEVRVMDVFMTIDDAVMAAGLVRALVQTCYEKALRGEIFPPVRHEVLRAANWRSARYGLTGDLVDAVAERALPAQQMMRHFLDFVRPALQDQHDWEVVSAHVEHMLHYGTGAARQLAMYQHTRNLRDVVDFIVAETAKGTE